MQKLLIMYTYSNVTLQESGAGMVSKDFTTDDAVTEKKLIDKIKDVVVKSTRPGDSCVVVGVVNISKLCGEIIESGIIKIRDC